MTELTTLDRRVAELAERYRPLAVAILKEAIRIPADQVDLPVDSGGDPRSGLSNHEGSRLRFLLDTIVDVGAVLHADDVGFDDYGNLVWTVTNASTRCRPTTSASSTSMVTPTRCRRCATSGATS
ncbi:MAG: hypothetical protein IPP16_13760 [Acidimicrobiaceae bacterium]|nr:hypothetical protein [Acidimicrobiaceae bacterium]